MESQKMPSSKTLMLKISDVTDRIKEVINVQERPSGEAEALAWVRNLLLAIILNDPKYCSRCERVVDWVLRENEDFSHVQCSICGFPKTRNRREI